MTKTVFDTDTDELKFTIQPDQYVNFWWGLLTAISIVSVTATGFSPWFVAPSVVMWFSHWLIVKCWSFKFREKTIAERKGVFSVLTREIHYFRIKSVRLYEPLHLRIFGLSNVDLVTSDPLIPILRIYGVSNGKKIYNYVRTETSKWRRGKEVTEMDVRPML